MLTEPLTEPSMATSDPRFQKQYYFEMTLFRRIVTTVLRVLFRLVTTIQVTGENHIPAHGPVVLAANHVTNFDVFLIQLSMSRPIFYMGKAELFNNPILDAALRRLGGFPVYRGERDQWAMDHSQKILDHGLVLGIFPEGTRSKGIGLRPAKTGASRLAQAARCPIVPVAIDGPQHLFKRFPARTKIVIRFGLPIYPKHGETHLELTDRMMFALADMLPEERRGAYRERPRGF